MSGIKLNLKAKIGLLIIAVISLGLYLFGKQLPQDQIGNFVQSAGPWAPIVYILIHQLSYVFAPISGLPFQIVGFYIFGAQVIFYSYFVMTLGAAINFFISKMWGRPLVVKLAGQEAIQKIDQLAEEYGLTSLVLLRLFQGGFGDFVSYAYGLTKIKFPIYMLISAVAIIPGQIIWYFVARKANSIEKFLVITWVLVIISLSILFLFHNLHKKYKKNLHSNTLE